MKDYKIIVYHYNSKKEVMSTTTLKTRPITRKRCLEIANREIAFWQGMACYSVTPLKSNK